MCFYCGNIYKNHNSELANASDVLKAGVLGTNQDLANYLTSGFWNEFESSPILFEDSAAIKSISAYLITL